MILNHAIRGSKGQICESSVTSLRLVHKSWLETITKVLQKSKEPLFHLELDKDNSLIAKVGEDGKLLDRFLDVVATKPSVPTFSVKMQEDVFVKENHSSLSKMLVHFGAGLVQLELHIPLYGGALNFISPKFSLPNLRKLQVKLSPIELPGTKSNNNVSHLINSLLNAAPSLTHFLVPSGCYHYYLDQFPLAFQLFTLPPSITTLELSCELTSDNLELFVKSDFSKLTSLTLLIPSVGTYTDGILYRILDKSRTTLRELVLHGDGGWEASTFVNHLRFPVMEKLEAVSCCSMYCQLEPGIASLETLLPKLSRLALLNQTPDMFRKWTENSCFKSRCENLTLHLGNENVGYFHPDYMVGVNLEMMQRIHLTSPNLRALDVTLSGAQVCGLKYLFLEMKTLVYLKIVVVGSTVGLDRDFWDALLIGVPIHFAKAFRRSIDFWEEAQLTNGSEPTIKNLQELKYLSLETHFNCLHDPLATEPLISDLTFLLAFLKMPKLEHLTLDAMFRASDEMAERLRSQGRTLIQSPAE